MSISINIKKTGVGTVSILAGGRTIGSIRGHIFPTKVGKIFIQRKFNEGLGIDEDVEVKRIMDGPPVDTLLEKSKCVVEWMNLIYDPDKFGSLHNIG